MRWRTSRLRKKQNRTKRMKSRREFSVRNRKRKSQPSLRQFHNDFSIEHHFWIAALVERFDQRRDGALDAALEQSLAMVNNLDRLTQVQHAVVESNSELADFVRGFDFDRLTISLGDNFSARDRRRIGEPVKAGVRGAALA